MTTRGIILLFLDGVGIGSTNPEINPFFRASLPTLRSLLGRKLPHTRLRNIRARSAALQPVNTTLGVTGLPQSGTGQTAIFTGVNASKKIGRHFGPYPTTDLRPVIETRNIFRQLLNAGKTVIFSNAFPKQFFDYTASGTRRLTVTTLSCMMTGIPLLKIEDLRLDRGISADLTRARWPELGFPQVPMITPEEAGAHLAEISAHHDFTLFEYWLTDHAGHSQEMTFAVEVLERFDKFLAGLLDTVDLGKRLIVLVSDHGNVEDLSTKSHTRNPVPCIAIGNHREEFLAPIKNLTHITPAIVRILTN
ncbi:MAG: alkaline phosphatase family protein [Ignavibacteriales bacterium]|nr:alkaline phosphatase family protein [Ignavibacteriales bacterium]